MGTPEISKTELKELMKEAIISVLTERKDLLEDAVSEAILDVKLALAIKVIKRSTSRKIVSCQNCRCDE